MARKTVKKTISKGERLGWPTMDQLKTVSLLAVVGKGWRLKVTRRQNAVSQPQQQVSSFQIP